MNAGKTLFAQLMDFLPWSTFMRIVAATAATARCAHCLVPNNFGPWHSRN